VARTEPAKAPEVAIARTAPIGDAFVDVTPSVVNPTTEVAPKAAAIAEPG